MKPLKIFIKVVIGIVAFTCSFFVVQTSYAATKTWTGGGADNNWDTPANWTPSGVPGPTYDALFSASNTKNCTIDAAANVKGFTIASGYTGTITQSSGNSVTIGNDGFSQVGGTFTGGDSAIQVGGDFSLTGGVFTSTADALNILGAGTSTFAGGTFNNNSGTVTFGSSYPYSNLNSGNRTYIITGSTTFNDLIFGDNDGYDKFTNTFVVATGTTLVSQGYFWMDSGGTVPVILLGGGQLSVQGNIEESYEPAYATGTTSVVLNGSGTQTIGDNSQCGCGYRGATVLPDISIAKTTGSVTLTDTLVVLAGNWNNSGTVPVDPNYSTVDFGPPYPYLLTPAAAASSSIAITGSSTFYDLVLGASNAENGSTFTTGITVATSTTLTVQHYLFFDAAGTTIQLLGGGVINAQGNIEEGNDQYYATGTVALFLDGTSTQTVGGNDLCPFYSCSGNAGDNLIVPSLTIAKTSGIAYMTNAVEVTATTTVSEGELDLATGTVANTVQFDGNFIVNSGTTVADSAQTTSTLIFGSGVANNGMIFLAGDGIACTVPPPDYVVIQSTSPGTQRTWSGSGNFVMRYVSLEDQSTTVPITVYNGTNAGNVTPLSGSGWNFVTNGRAELLQSASSTSNAASTLALPSFGFAPHAGDLVVVSVSAQGQGISAPTDNAGNTYNLVSSSTVGSDALALYYAENIVSTSTFDVTVHGTGSGDPLSGTAFEYTGMLASSTVLDASSSNLVYPGTSTALTSFSASGQSANELYFGTMTMTASTTATPGSGWTERADMESTLPFLYNEEISTTTQLSTAATWTAATSTSYAAILGIFRTPFQLGYQPEGTLDSVTFDTGVTSGAQLNSFTWQGSTPSNSAVKFQFAGSNSPTGPWNYRGYDGTSNTSFPGPGESTSPGASVGLLSTTNGYALFSGYRYYRYRVILFPDSTYAYTPTVSQVTLNWSP
jgi:hypothetical protein